jgi:hypothetical protein
LPHPTSLFAWRNAIGKWDLSLLPAPKKPIRVRSQHLSEGSKLIIKDVTVTVFDFGDRGSVELDSDPSELA